MGAILSLSPTYCNAGRQHLTRFRSPAEFLVIELHEDADIQQMVVPTLSHAHPAQRQLPLPGFPE
jgi:hypothetical protein